MSIEEEWRIGQSGFARTRKGGKIHKFWKWSQNALCNRALKQEVIDAEPTELDCHIPDKAEACLVCLKIRESM